MTRKILVVAAMAAVGCSGSTDAGLVSSGSAALVGEDITITADTAEEDGDGNFTNEVPLPFGPPPGEGDPSLIDPEEYGLCGIAAVGGYFDELSAAHIGVDSNGYYVGIVTQSADARAGGYDAPSLRIRCVALSEFQGIPDITNSYATYKSVLHQEGVGVYNEDFMSRTTESACLWQGFEGAISFEWDGDPNVTAEAGAYESTSAACVDSDPSDPACDAVYSRVVAKTIQGDMTSHSICIGFSDLSWWPAWKEHPAANQQRLFDGDFTGALEDENYCVLAGIFGGGVQNPEDNSEGATFTIAIDPDLPPPPYAGDPQYMVSASWAQAGFTVSGSVGAWGECFPLDQSN